MNDAVSLSQCAIVMASEIKIVILEGDEVTESQNFKSSVKCLPLAHYRLLWSQHLCTELNMQQRQEARWLFCLSEFVLEPAKKHVKVLVSQNGSLGSNNSMEQTDKAQE